MRQVVNGPSKEELYPGLNQSFTAKITARTSNKDFDDARLVNYEQRIVLSAFVNLIYTKNPDLSLKLHSILELAFVRKAVNKKERGEHYANLYKELKASGELKDFYQVYSRFLDLARHVRKKANSEIYAARQATTADSIAYVVNAAAKANVDPGILAEFFRRNAKACISITAHPTNPTSLEYTKVGNELDTTLVNSGIRSDATHWQILKLLVAEMAGEKKTQSQEMGESILFLDNIYDDLPKVWQRIKDAVEPYPTYRLTVDLRNIKLFDGAVWATGDGDGNPNATAETMQEGINLLRAAIKAKYLTELAVIDGAEQVQHKLQNDLYQNINDLLTDLEKIDGTDMLQLKVRNFGFHYAKIDIRHNSKDIMTTFDELLRASGLVVPESGVDCKYISRLLEDTAKLKMLRESMGKVENKTAKNILQRLQLAASQPDMFEKFIIAETAASENVLASMLLLKVTRDEKQKIDMDIVTLSESVKELEKTPAIIKELLNYYVYREHVVQRKRIVPMVARSDTVRRNGVGANVAQEKCIGEIYKLIQDEFKGEVEVNAFNGGGCALQRGGGNVTEVAHNHGRSARRYGADMMGASYLTIQGIQNQLLFAPADGAIEALISQNLYATLQTTVKKYNQDGTKERYIKPRTASDELVRDVNFGQDKKLATSEVESMQLEVFDNVCTNSMNGYFALVGDPDLKDEKGLPISGDQRINQLFTNAPFVSVVLANLSSRPGSRKQGNSGSKVIDIKGKNPTFLDNRAITSERLSGHFGPHALVYFGLLNALSSMDTRVLHNMYRGSKSCRDLMLNTATSLYMADFDTAWQMLLGEVPKINEIKNLATNFEKRKSMPQNNADINEINKETLAYIQCYAMGVSANIYRCIFGKEPLYNLKPGEEFSLKTPLAHGWPSLAAQMEVRSLLGEFAHYTEAKETYAMNQNPEMEITPEFKELLQLIYAACDISSNAPEAMMNMLTRTIEQGTSQLSAKL